MKHGEETRDVLLRWLNRRLARRQQFQNISRLVIYRIGNIGDILCAVPAMLAVREFFPRAQVTLLTSPSRRGMPGAQELLSDAWFLDRIWTYYADEIATIRGRLELVAKMRAQGFQLWINLPNDRADHRHIVRDMIFAGMIGAGGAVGFEPGPPLPAYLTLLAPLEGSSA